jgi:hypothetical protein
MGNDQVRLDPMVEIERSRFDVDRFRVCLRGRDCGQINRDRAPDVGSPELRNSSEVAAR